MTNSSNNLVYKAFGFATASLLALAPVSGEYVSIGSSYQGNYYSNNIATSNQNVSLQITVEDLFNAEIEKFKKLIYDNFNTRVTKTWVPAKNGEDKSCLFVKCDIQETFKDDYEKLSNFEFDLFVALKNDLENSIFFNMIAIL